MAKKLTINDMLLQATGESYNNLFKKKTVHKEPMRADTFAMAEAYSYIMCENIRSKTDIIQKLHYGVVKRALGESNQSIGKTIKASIGKVFVVIGKLIHSLFTFLWNCYVKLTDRTKKLKEVYKKYENKIKEFHTKFSAQVDQERVTKMFNASFRNSRGNYKAFTAAIEISERLHSFVFNIINSMEQIKYNADTGETAVGQLNQYMNTSANLVAGWRNCKSEIDDAKRANSKLLSRAYHFFIKGGDKIGDHVDRLVKLVEFTKKYRDLTNDLKKISNDKLEEILTKDKAQEFKIILFGMSAVVKLIYNHIIDCMKVTIRGLHTLSVDIDRMNRDSGLFG